MSPLGAAGHAVRFARTPQDVALALGLRARRFRGSADPSADTDAFDAAARHVLIEEADGGRLVCCFRLLAFGSGAEASGSYAAQFYDLSGLAGYRAPVLEMGRFCVAAGESDPAILRLAWGAAARLVAERGIGLIFGCTSFAGTEAAPYRDAFALLRAGHLGPAAWRPRVKAPQVVRFAAGPAGALDRLAGLRAMPPLLRSYLAMGGWVSDHAVIDRDLGTLHVFTAIEARSVPAARMRSLLAAA